jgi:hypothetical protein
MKCIITLVLMMFSFLLLAAISAHTPIDELVTSDLFLVNVLSECCQIKDLILWT